jgi:hypothetical protein
MSDIDEFTTDEFTTDEFTTDEFDSDGAAPTEPVGTGATESSSAPSLQGALPLAVSTGDASVDRTLATLTELDGLPLEEHAAVFTRVHRGLQDALVDLDRG